jgi:deoxyribose-phosphate aldolase
MSEAGTKDIDLARRALRLLDLTDLSDGCREDHVEALIQKALTPHGPVAAICIWPTFVSGASQRLRGSKIRLATVINFPAGGEDIERAVDVTREALRDGANEIDLVMPWRALLRGDPALPRAMIEAVAQCLPSGHRLKVIIESGELRDTAYIDAASRIAIEAGAHFIKTSTGKTPVSATPAAARVMLKAIKEMGKPVGFKASGGIRTLADAQVYLDIADEIMGPDWVSPETFRFGASGLLDALLAALKEDGA